MTAHIFDPPVGLSWLPDYSRQIERNINEAARLIAAQTKVYLYRGKFRDEAGAQFAMGEVSDELTRLKRETARRLVTPLRPVAGRSRYNINTDR